MDTKLLYSILTFNFNNFGLTKIKLCLSLNRKQFNQQSIYFYYKGKDVPQKFDRWQLLLDVTELATAAFHRIKATCSVKRKISFHHIVMMDSNI